MKRILKKVLVLTIPESIRLKMKVRRALGDRSELLLVHQMGKVGSTAVLRSLEGRCNLPVIQTHFLSTEGIETAGQWHLDHGASLIPFHIRFSKELRGYLRRVNRIKIVSLVREPIAREVSSYFQLGPRLFEGLKDPKLSDVERIAKVREEVGRGVENLARTSSHYNSWFDNELKRVFGVNIFESGFDPESGWTYFERGNVEGIVVRTEDLNSVWSEASRHLLGDRAPKLAGPANVGGAKSNGSLYRDLLGKLRFPSDTVEEVLAQKTVSHFYSQEERERFYERWSE